jgi:hypothetical protein
MEQIVAAAYLHSGKVWWLPPPNRHHHILLEIYHETGDIVRDPALQGFITTTGRFVTRKEAAQIVVESGQIKEPKWPPVLFSEDLW